MTDEARNVQMLSQIREARLARAISALYDTYTPEGVGIWLKGRKQSLGGVSPLDAIESGRLPEVVALAESYDGMVAT